MSQIFEAKYLKSLVILSTVLSLAACITTSAQTSKTENPTPNQSVSITDAILTNSSANCADYVNAYSSEALELSSDLVWTGALSISLDGDKCTFSSNAVPNHSFNDAGGFRNAFSEQTLSLSIPSNPERATEATALSLQFDNAVMLNGVKVDLLAAGCFGVGNGKIGCNDRASLWRYDPMSEFSDFGTDSHNAHTQPTGEYHYHGDPNALFDDNDDSKASPVIGFAADGFPIFGSYFDDEGSVRKALSSYQLLEGSRPTGEGNPGGNYDGTFVDDYTFSEGSGDLDECNGMTVNGVYGYYVTGSYPHILGCFSGTPDPSFRKAGRGN